MSNNSSLSIGLKVTSGKIFAFKENGLANDLGANDTNLYLIIIVAFILFLIAFAIYFCCLHCKTNDKKSSQLVRTASYPNRNYFLTKDLKGSFEDINQLANQQQPSCGLTKGTNLQPASTEAVSMHDELRSIIATKLKPPPSTLEHLIEPSKDSTQSIDIEIKQEGEKDDIFSVISAKSLEKYKSSRSRPDKSKSDKKSSEKSFKSFDTTDTTTDECDTSDRVIVLKSGTFENKLNRPSKIKSGSKIRKSKSPKLKTYK